MNLLKSTEFLLKSLYLRPFHSLNARGDFCSRDAWMNRFIHGRKYTLQQSNYG